MITISLRGLPHQLSVSSHGDPSRLRPSSRYPDLVALTEPIERLPDHSSAVALR